MPNGPHKITGSKNFHVLFLNLVPYLGLPFDEAICKSEKSIEDAEIQVYSKARKYNEKI